VSTEKGFLDVTDRGDFECYWRPGSRTAFLAEHVLEHLNADGAWKTCANCFKFLKHGGWLRVAVPDGFHPEPSYIELVKPGGTGIGAYDHKILYNYKSLRSILEEIGFSVELLEYWDENGQFHFRQWDSKDGHVSRSKRYDERNKDGALKYTSLIIDAIKQKGVRPFLER
jgi:predicted SAM-dependent methyltransferase